MNAFPPPDFDPVNGSDPVTVRSGDPARRRFRRATAVGLTAGLLGGGAVGLVAVVPSLTNAASGTVTLQDDTATDQTTDATTDLAPGDTAPERGERVRDLLQTLVDDGTITAAQADAVAEHLAANMPGRGGRDGHGGHGGFGRGVAAQAVADSLGVTVDELVTALRDGQSIADVAAAQGVDVQVAIDAMVAEVQAHLDEEVAEGDLTQEEADARLATATERITERVNTAGSLGMGRGGRGGMGGGHMHDDDTDDTADTSTDSTS